MQLPNHISLLKVKINLVKIRDVVSLMEDAIREKYKSFQICLTNTYTVVLMQNDHEFLNTTNSSELVLADGLPLVWASKLLNIPIPERIAGFELFKLFSKKADKCKYRYFLLGSNERTIGKMISIIKEHWPNIVITGCYCPPMRSNFSQEETEEMLNKVNDASPDILWVSLSAPKQELWINKNKNRINTPLAIGIGAAFEYIAGEIKRAPKWAQKMGLEWFFRFCQEPKRLWKRYLIGNTVFSYLILLEFTKKLFVKKTAT